MKDKEFFLKDRLNDSQIGKFKLFEDEELIFATREHWLPLTFRLIRQTVVGLLVASMFASVFILLLHSTSLALNSFFLVLLIASIVSIRDLIHWSFHLYIATTKQIIEIHYSPLLSEAINSVLLDQIRCTEIDVEMYGIVPELIGIGNVELTFDRPTHKEEFIIRDIRSPRKIANLLSAQIHQGLKSTTSTSLKQPMWVRELQSNKYRFLGEVNYGYTAN